MTVIHAKHALIDGELADDVYISVENGTISGIDSSGKADRKIAILHRGLEILAGDEHAEIRPRRDAARRTARIGVWHEGRRKHRIEHHLGRRREHDVVFLVDVGKLRAENVRRDARNPEARVERRRGGQRNDFARAAVEHHCRAANRQPGARPSRSRPGSVERATRRLLRASPGSRCRGSRPRGC